MMAHLPAGRYSRREKSTTAKKSTPASKSTSASTGRPRKRGGQAKPVAKSQHCLRRFAALHKFKLRLDPEPLYLVLREAPPRAFLDVSSLNLAASGPPIFLPNRQRLARQKYQPTEVSTQCPDFPRKRLSHPARPKHAIMLKARSAPRRRDSNETASGKPGAVQWASGGTLLEGYSMQSPPSCAGYRASVSCSRQGSEQHERP